MIQNPVVKAVLLIFVLCITTGLFSCSNGHFSNKKKPEQAEKFIFTEKPTSSITFLSTQMNPVEEAGKMRNFILKDFPGSVDFKPNDSSFLYLQIDSLLKRNSSASILIGALHGDLVTLYEKDALQPIDSIYSNLKKRNFSENLLKLSRLNDKDMFYIPWMQASFVMIANKKALAYLPPGANLDELTYDQLALWSKTIFEKTGVRALGFPAGGKGLMHRFFQGYLYPSFTASTLLKFRGNDAKKMWEYFRDLWQYVQPSSLVYSTMADPLIAGDVWIAWDHTARLVKIFEDRPDDFIAFPAPVGPKGRGFMPVISGLAIPKSIVNIQNQALLIDYLTQVPIQNRTLAETGFFPVVASVTDSGIPYSLRGLCLSVDTQANSPESIPTLLPIGLGEHGDDFNNYYMLTFSEIVLDGKDITTVLNANAAELQKIITSENAKCWLPDRSNERPCKIE